ncbi:FCD domain-containing protein [Streptomyces tagetis]|uniref:FCD domain-containing protein n=1 Tax=Streptomyces tagetis TaxID=2820809 RepID=UPI001FF9D744|nr:FCD domain-containing protein [Streptomyces sp. RG38]
MARGGGLTRRDAGRLVAADSALHGAVAAPAGNDVLARLIALVDRRVRWYHAPVARLRGADAWAEHAEIIEAVAEGEAERAGESMRRHADSATAANRDRRAPGAS